MLMSSKQKKIKAEQEVTLGKAIVKGDAATKLSMVIMGFGCMARKQIIKGLIILFFEIAFIVYMVNKGAHNLAMLPSLGSNAQTKTLTDAGIYVYTKGDNSVLILLYGVVALFVVAAIVLLWVIQMKESYKLQLDKKKADTSIILRKIFSLSEMKTFT